MRFNISFRRFAVLGMVFIFTGKAYAVTSAEYAAAGLQLYNQKNYPQAIQYYSAAISLDSNNAAALQGRANCYYGLGQLPQAIGDYQKVYAIAPSPQLGQFIQALQAKAGTAAPVTTAPMAGTAAPAAADSYNQGVALYQQRQYAAAVPYLQKATQDNPSDSKAYYYLGATYMMMGDNKNAALNLALSNQKSPNPSVANYVTQLKARLSPEDQQWVDGQLAASTSASSGRVAGVKPVKKFGIRLEPGISTLSMNDFLNNAQTNQSAAATMRATDPTIDFVGHVPTLSPNIGFEAVYRLTPNLEIGLPFSMIPAGIADDSLTGANGVTVTDSFNFSAFAIGLNLRYMFLNGDFQPFVAAGGLVAPMNIDYTSSYSSNGTSLFPSVPTAFTTKGNFTSMGFGGQIQLGVDWHLGDTFVITPFGGYQFISASNFTSTISGSSGSGGGSGQTVQLSVITTPDGKVVTPTSGGNLVVPVATSAGVLAPGTAATGAVPASVDLGGVNAGLQISLFF